MEIIETGIDGLKVIEPNVFSDSRGYFFESYNRNNYRKLGLDYLFVQDNQSRSTYGVIRGLHYQEAPFSQSKLVRVLEGTIYDVAVDIRENSSTFGQWYGIELSSANFKQLLVPKGFAHGFSVISPHATVFYKCDEFYHPEAERGIYYNDPMLEIDWKIPSDKAVLSNKDLQLPFFEYQK